jgi:amylosucrase
MNTLTADDERTMKRRVAATLERVLPRLQAQFESRIDADAWSGYEERLRRHFDRLFRSLHYLYGREYDFFYHVEAILASATRNWVERPASLKALDALRAHDPHWYQSHRVVGAMCYVDCFAEDISGLIRRIPYLADLGITYLHLMPVFKSPAGDNDGGYAVSSYREVNPKLGTMADIEHLASELRQRGISLVLDFVFNHTSDEHDWARRAQSGDEDYQAFYRMYPDRTMPDAYEKSIATVFPDEFSGCFSYRNAIRKWVWTSFYNFQWDLNYENPEVFRSMMEEMLFLANRGVEGLRLDAIAFTWKELGTSCQNLAGAHHLVQAFNAIKSVAAPAMVFKSEAIVHPDEVRRYIGLDKCELSYNPQLMALLWEALATQDCRILRRAMLHRFQIDDGCAWVNYVRCHDDIGWGFGDDDVEAAGINPAGHRRFLTEFYTGNFEGSFARGAKFQEDPESGQARVSGTCASLCGLESALEAGDDEAIELAIQRILLLYGVIMTIGGVPLIYLGDEIATLNDYRYEKDPDKCEDSRWLHRSPFDWKQAENRWDTASITGRVYNGIARLITLRHQNPAFTRADTDIFDPGNDKVFAYFRVHENHTSLVCANFSGETQYVDAKRLRQLGMRKSMTDLITGRTILAARQLELAPYQFAVLARSA